MFETYIGPLAYYVREEARSDDGTRLTGAW